VRGRHLLCAALTLGLVAAVAGSAYSQDCSPAATPNSGPLRAPLDPRPEARADLASAEAGKRVTIDVLANDKGVPHERNAELQIEQNPNCGDAGIEGQRAWYQGGPECVGKNVTFKYRARLLDAQSCQYEWRSALVTVTVTSSPAIATPELSCEVTDSKWRLIKVEGGQFVKSEAPADLADFITLVDKPSFTVGPFCLMDDDVSAKEFDKFFSAIPESQKHEKFPEAFDGDSNDQNVLNVVQPDAAATGISYRMAEAYASYQRELVGRAVELPTLYELIAAVWELERKHPASPDAQNLSAALRSGNLQWTNTPCPDNPEPGYFLTLGPQVQGPLDAPCYEQTRRGRTAFRLIVK
jgi:hypothetical protein